MRICVAAYFLKKSQPKVRVTLRSDQQGDDNIPLFLFGSFHSCFSVWSVLQTDDVLCGPKITRVVQEAESNGEGVTDLEDDASVCMVHEGRTSRIIHNSSRQSYFTSQISINNAPIGERERVTA